MHEIHSYLFIISPPVLVIYIILTYCVCACLLRGKVLSHRVWLPFCELLISCFLVSPELFTTSSTPPAHPHL